MLRLLAGAFWLAGLAPAWADDPDLHVQQRKLYALAVAAPEWCPGIETRWGARGSIGYDSRATEDEPAQLAAARERWFRVFRETGDRAVACEAIMQTYGPGGQAHLFQWR